MASCKVLLIANTDWYLYNFRLSFARYLQQQGAEVIMASPGGSYHAEVERAGFRWIEWQVGRRSMDPLQEVRAIRALAQIYQRETPDLVHHFTIKPVLYGSLAARLAHVPAVVNSVTGLGYIFLKNGTQGSLLRLVILPFYRLAFSHPNLQVIFENSSDQEMFLRHRLVKKERTSVIQGVGVDPDYFVPTPEPDQEPPRVVFPARMLIDKGLLTLVDAARILKPRVPVQIVLAGEPDPGNPATVDEASLHQWEQEGLVEWWGFQRNMEQVYQNSQIVTLPSFGEGLPTVLIEAAACARPIVTTDVSGCREVVQHGINGLLVPPDSPGDLAQALEMLLVNRELRQTMGQRGREIVLERFTDRIVNQKTFAVYQKVIS